MKKLVVLGMILFSLYGERAGAQIRLSLGVNLGTQPVWGPVGYDRAEYYYLPDIDAYYNVRKSQFVYREGNRWAYGASLPARYGRYDLYGGYKVVVNEPTPYLRDNGNYYRNNYGRYKNWKGDRQQVIRDSREEKYRPNRERDQRDHHDQRDKHDQKDQHDRGNH